MEVEGEPDRFVAGSGHHRLGVRRIAEERLMDEFLGRHDRVEELLVLGQLPDEGRISGTSAGVAGSIRNVVSGCAMRSGSSGGQAVEGLLDVGDEVLGRFDADREPDKVIGNRGAGPFRHPALLGEALGAPSDVALWNRRSNRFPRRRPPAAWTRPLRSHLPSGAAISCPGESGSPG